MDYFFTTIYPGIMAGALVIMVILDVINHINKKKLTEYVRLSEERRQRYIRVDSMLVSTYRKSLWMLLPIWLLMVLSIYYFLPSLFPSLLIPTIEVILFWILMLDDYFYRKSFLKSLDG